MTRNDEELLRQMIKAGRFNAVVDLLQKYNTQRSKEMIEQMGEHWCCHPQNAPKKGNYGI